MNGKLMQCKWIVLSVLLLMFPCSCTVFEDRDECPNYLAIDFKEVDNDIKEWQMWFFTEQGELVFKDTVSRSSYSSSYIVEMPRHTELRCFFWGNIRGATNLDESYSYRTNISKKADVSADSIYFFADTINTMREESSLKVVPRKEFATVDIFVKGWVGTEYEAEMVLECARSGFYVGKDFFGGTVYTKAEVYDTGNYYTQFRCRMLRQQDTENIVLRLYIREHQQGGQFERVVQETEIPIGKYLEENGYDMTGSTLEDIVMEVDYSYNNFMIKAADWEATYKISKEM